MRGDTGSRGGRLYRWLGRLGAAGAVAAGLALVPGLAAGGGARLGRLVGERDRVDAAIRGLEQENALKRKRVHELKTNPRAIEDIARDELQMIHPGDVVIRVEGP